MMIRSLVTPEMTRSIPVQMTGTMKFMALWEQIPMICPARLPAANMNLATGVVSNDGFGFTDQINITGGSGRLEIRATDHDDDRITDFTSGEDIIHFANIAGLDYAGLSISCKGGDAIIDYGIGSITLNGIAPNSLTSADFEFIL